jgi:hypothetical protein
VNEGRDILASNRDFIHFPESNKEGEDIEITDELRIDGTSFQRVPGTIN